MPRIAYVSGPIARWGSRKTSRVELTHNLILGGAPVRFTLELPRACFEDFQLGLSAFEALARKIFQTVPSCRHSLKGRPIKVAVRLPSASVAAISFHRADLPPLKAGLREWKAQWDDFAVTCGAESALASHLYSRCFPGVARFIRHTPRGKNTAGQFTSFLPAALHAAKILVASGNQHREIQQKIAFIVNSDEELGRYLLAAKECGWNAEQALVVALVDRAFRDAWEKYDHPGLIYSASKDVRDLRKQRSAILPSLRFRDPQDVLREYLNRDERLTKHLQRTLNSKKSSSLAIYTDWAQQTFLGPPGQASRFYRLT